MDQAAATHRIGPLDSMRGLAALTVCFQHVLDRIPWVPGSAPEKALRGVLKRLMDGGAAVDFFFVLSGFVLALPYVAKHARALRTEEFLVRRVLRIMPTYWGSLVILFSLRALAPGAFEASPNEPILPYIALIFHESVGGLNAVIWSLVVEMQVSIILPVFLALLMQRPSRAGAFAILLMSLLLPQFIYGKSALMFLPLFVFGALLAYYQDELVAMLRGCPWWSRGLLWVVAAPLVWNRGLQSVWRFPDMKAEMLSALGGGLLIMLVLSEATTPKLLRAAPVRFLGAISYSLYLAHLPIVMAGAFILQGVGWSAAASVWTAFVVAVVGSSALYYVVERPSIGWGKRVSQRWPRAGALTLGGDARATDV